jgi:hypothetical protein
MTSRHQIHWITRSDRLNHHQRIRSVGGVNPDGSRWKVSEEAAIAGIEKGSWKFYVVHGGRNVDVIITVSKYGSKYIKTALDGLHPESLLALPEARSAPITGVAAFADGRRGLNRGSP